jgi:hypothetical protein
VPINFLEQLVAEWYEYRGFFVRRNVNVGKRTAGGHEGELDVVAFHPVEKLLVQIETSMDAESWAQREEKFKRKFNTGKKHIPALFGGFEPLPEVQHIAVFGMLKNKTRDKVGGGDVVPVCELLNEIRKKIPSDYAAEAVPEQFVILRTLQFAAQCWKT